MANVIKMNVYREKIKIDPKDEVKGFYTLLTKAKDSFVCLPDHEYIIPKYLVCELVKEDINFKIKKREH